MTKYKYHKSMSYTEGDTKVSHQTQLYKTGIYCIVNNDPNMQLNLKPSDLVKIEKKINKKVAEGKITDLQLGPEIVVAKVNGFWEEIST